ncbi:hypothetical protein KSW81_004041 [Nannochloris sp. 'desiccata']|nr:hypothetical protein KSW81_004041 [Chlorella desiccata (nom. nud.)]
MAPKEQKSKEAKAIAAANSSKGKKKKWSKGKLKEKMITPSVLADRLRINGSLARAAIRDLAEQGLIKEVSKSNMQQIYTRATKEVDA